MVGRQFPQIHADDGHAVADLQFALGKFFEGFVVFMGGVSMRLIARQFHLADAEKGLVTSASLFGILLGTILLGGLSDDFGRKRMFIAHMIIFCMFLTLLILVGNFLSLVICLVGIGMALGCDYPTAHRSFRKTSRASRAVDSCSAHSPFRRSAPCAEL